MSNWELQWPRIQDKSRIMFLLIAEEKRENSENVNYIAVLTSEYQPQCVWSRKKPTATNMDLQNEDVCCRPVPGRRSGMHFALVHAIRNH
jgi:hypothetical protein